MHDELPAVLIVLLPMAGEFERFTRDGSGQRPHNRRQGIHLPALLTAVRQQFCHRIAVFFVLKRDSLEHAGDHFGFRGGHTPAIMDRPARPARDGVHPRFGADFDSRLVSREAAKNAKENLSFWLFRLFA